MSDSLEKAALGIIDVRFTPSASDLKVLVRHVPDRAYHAIVTILSRTGAFAVAAGVSGLVLWNFQALQASMLEKITLAIAGGLVGLMAFRMLVEGAWQRSIRKSLFLPAQSLHVTSDGHALTIEDEHVRTRIAFSGIERLARLESHLVVYRKRMLILALPKAAFAQPEIFDAFASFLQSRMAAHQTHQPMSEKTA